MFLAAFHQLYCIFICIWYALSTGTPNNNKKKEIIEGLCGSSHVSKPNSWHTYPLLPSAVWPFLNEHVAKQKINLIYAHENSTEIVLIGQSVSNGDLKQWKYELPVHIVVIFLVLKFLIFFCSLLVSLTDFISRWWTQNKSQSVDYHAPIQLINLNI